MTWSAPNERKKSSLPVLSTPVTSAPYILASCTANVPAPPPAPLIKTFLPVQNPVGRASSCLGPKLIPLSIELDHLEQGQGTTTTLAPTYPFSLLACPHRSIQCLLHPPAAYGLARLRPSLIVNDLRSMLLQVANQLLKCLLRTGLDSAKKRQCLADIPPPQQRQHSLLYLLPLL